MPRRNGSDDSKDKPLIHQGINGFTPGLNSLPEIFGRIRKVNRLSDIPRVFSINIVLRIEF